MPFNAIFAVDTSGLIGLGGKLPWRLPKDLEMFKEKTSDHTVIMGRKTWDSLPDKFKPLPNRKNIVMTRDRGWSAQGCETMAGEVEVFDYLKSHPDEEVFIIGGAEIYNLFAGMYDRVFVTMVMHSHHVHEEENPTYIKNLGAIVDNMFVENCRLNNPDDRHDLPFLWIEYHRHPDTPRLKSWADKMMSMVSDL